MNELETVREAARPSSEGGSAVGAWIILGTFLETFSGLFLSITHSLFQAECLRAMSIPTISDITFKIKRIGTGEMAQWLDAG